MKRRIVVVDDDTTVLRLVQDILELEDYAVLTCSTGTELHRLLSDPPSLIILDVFLQKEDGRELCRRLKHEEQTKHIPVILYSAHITEQQALQTSGADDFLEKPFHLRDLLAKVVQYLPPATF